VPAMPIAEGQQEHAVQQLTIEARQALRGTYMGETRVGSVLSPVEKALVETCSKLIKAVEVASASSPLVVPVIDLEEARTLDDIYERITGTAKGPQQGGRKFVISFPEVELGVDEIWPNGDAPENPTPDDVIAVMRETERAHPMTVTHEWRLIDTLYVRHHTDTNADMEVEWDGS
jgi:hypothetical protein